MEHSLAKLKQIVQQAATAASSEKQMSYIVSAVCGAMDVEVCSLYLADAQGVLTLAATEGLDPGSIGRVKLKTGEGLVGTVASSRHPLNVEDAAQHPAFHYFPETHEEQYCAFMGVPLVHLRRLIGVLVVQERNERRFSDEEEAFLVTIAAQLAAVVATIESPAEDDSAASELGSTRRVVGIKGSRGIGIGRIHIVSDAGLEQVADREINDVPAELEKLHLALQQTRAELAASSSTLAASLPEDVAAIFSVYRMLLDSGDLLTDIEEKIRAGNWAPGAIRATVSEFASLFDAMEDPYFQARGEDIRNIGNKLYAKLRGATARPAESGESLILAGELVSITDIARYRPDQLAGILCTGGSALSHTAVLANALGLPAVMGTGEIKDLTENSLAVIDGHHGQVILNPSEAVVREFQALEAREHSLISGLEHLKDQPAVTPDGFHVRLYANTGLLADISPGLERGAEGIGLYRSEIPFMVHDNFPTEEEQFQIYSNVLTAYAGKPVYMRTLDIGGDKALPYYSFTEDNPSLGWRGIRFSLDNVPIFMTQLRAMLRASEGVDNLRVLLPMVSRVDEVDGFQELLTDACTQLGEEGHHIARPAVGIMVEVPAAVTLLPFIARRIDFISIGSNDLAQYLLAVDRNNPRVSRLFDNLHPAVIHEIHRIITEARQFGLPVGLCGEMASDPLAVVLLLGMGIDTLSMSAFNLPRIKWLIRSLPRTAAEKVLERALVLEHENEIRSSIKEVLVEHELGELVTTG
jgi:phosphotransferase system enzyme I (PtsI)/phosphotransferase system enzyme I (PtsP)